MKINFTQTGWRDYVYWETHDKKTLKRINNVIEDITGASNRRTDCLDIGGTLAEFRDMPADKFGICRMVSAK